MSKTYLVKLEGHVQLKVDGDRVLDEDEIIDLAVTAMPQNVQFESPEGEIVDAYCEFSYFDCEIEEGLETEDIENDGN